MNLHSMRSRTNVFGFGMCLGFILYFFKKFAKYTGPVMGNHVSVFCRYKSITAEIISFNYLVIDGIEVVSYTFRLKGRSFFFKNSSWLTTSFHQNILPQANTVFLLGC